MDQIPAHYQQAASLIVENLAHFSNDWTIDLAFDYPIDQEPWLPQNIFGGTTPDRVAHAGAINAYCEVITSLVKMAAVTARWPHQPFGLKQQLVLSPIKFEASAALSPRDEGIWLTVGFNQCFPTLQIVDPKTKCLLPLDQIMASHKHPTGYVTTNDMLGFLDDGLTEERAHMSSLPVGSPFYVPYLN